MPDMDKSDLRILLVTAPADSVEALADALLDARLVACVNVIPGVRSLYWWEGKKEEAQESLLVIKTREDLVKRVTERVVEMHPYEVPEVVAVPIVGGHAPYLDWVEGETR